MKGGLTAVWRFVRTLARAARLLTREPAVPRPLRACLALGLLPWPGPIDEIVLAGTVCALAIFYPLPMRRAWRRARELTDMSLTTPRRAVRVSSEVWDAAGARAESEGRTVSDVVRVALRDYAAGTYGAREVPTRGTRTPAASKR